MDHTELNWDPPKESRAPKIPKKEWEKHRTWICDLHRNGSTLEEIMSVMRYHSTQEGTFFEPTRKQYVSRFKKWNLRRYGLHQSVLATGARQSSGSSQEKALLAGLQYHQSKCCWCEPASPNDPATQHNARLAAEHGPLSEKEVSQKLDLADFHLAAKNLDDAWILYAEVLYRSYQCSQLDRLLIAVKVLYSSIHFNQQKTARDHLACLLLMDEDDSVAIAEPLWMMHLLRGMICQTGGEFGLATQHMQRAAEMCDKAGNIPHRGRILHAQKELISEIAGRLEQKAELQPKLPFKWLLPLLGNDFRRFRFPRASMELLIEWCSKQVEGDDYRVMLNFSREKPWTKAPNLQSFQNFERTSLFCHLWQKYRDAQEANSRGASSWREAIISIVEDFEQSLQISAPMIFSTVASLRGFFKTAKRAPEYTDSTLEQIARQSLESLRKYFLYTEPWIYYEFEIIFFETYASLSSDIEATDEQMEFRKLTQTFVRQMAHTQLPRNASNASPVDPEHPREAYLWSTTSATRTEGLVVEENIDDKKAPMPSQNQFATPILRPPSGTLGTNQESGKRPASFASVDMLATPRSSLSSSKTSLRSFQRIGRVAELLLKRGGSGANQLPSEIMNRDSQSSWSLRRLTGVSYLSATSEMTMDGQAEQDSVMEDAPF